MKMTPYEKAAEMFPVDKYYGSLWSDAREKIARLIVELKGCHHLDKPYRDLLENLNRLRDAASKVVAHYAVVHADMAAQTGMKSTGQILIERLGQSLSKTNEAGRCLAQWEKER